MVNNHTREQIEMKLISMHHEPGEGEAVMQTNDVHPPTNCSTCHRGMINPLADSIAAALNEPAGPVRLEDSS